MRVLAAGRGNPGGDIALIELRVRDVGPHTPLLGSYGRYGFSQPGGLWFYVLALPYRLLGSSYASLQVGVLALNVAAVTIMLAVARRRGGVVPVLVVAAMAGVLMHGLGPQWPGDPWEPHGLTLPCAALLFLSYDAVLGSPASLVGTAVVAMVIAEAQAGLVVFSVLIVVWTGGVVLVRSVSSGQSPEAHAARRSTVRASVVAVVLIGVLALPPLLALLRGDTGNLGDLVRSMRNPPAPVLGFGGGWRAVALEFGPNAPWLRPHQPLLPFTTFIDVSRAWVIPPVLILLVAVLVIGARRRVPSALLSATVVIGTVGAFTALARLIGPLYFWIPEWTRTLGFAAWVAIAWGVYDIAGRDRRRTTDRIAIPLLCVILSLVTVANVADAVRFDRLHNPSVDAVHRLAAAVPDLHGGATLVTAESDPSRVLGDDPGMPTLVLDLERAGVDVVTEADLADRYGAHRANPERAVRELRLLTDRDRVPSGYHVVATADPLSSKQRSERNRILRAHPELDKKIPDRDQFFKEHPELFLVGMELNATAAPVLTLAERRLR